MGIECAYSFTDLYRAAYGKPPENEVMKKLSDLSQGERNSLVAQWAQLARWETRARVGSDGVKYLAFAPSFKT